MDKLMYFAAGVVSSFLLTGWFEGLADDAPSDNIGVGDE